MYFFLDLHNYKLYTLRTPSLCRIGSKFDREDSCFCDGVDFEGERKHRSRCRCDTFRGRSHTHVYRQEQQPFYVGVKGGYGRLMLISVTACLTTICGLPMRLPDRNGIGSKFPSQDSISTSATTTSTTRKAMILSSTSMESPPHLE